MIRSVSAFIRVGILPAALLSVLATADAAFGMQADANKPGGFSMVPTSQGDHFVPGKYDKTGTYIPPHYQPVAKPTFHGYFFKKGTAGYDGLNSDRAQKMGNADKDGRPSNNPN